MAEKFVLPSNVEAERCVLGAMLISSSAASIALAALQEDSFSDVDPRNKIVFRAMKELADKGTAIDAQTVNDQLILTKLKEEAGSPDYLLDLVSTSINPSNVDHYINIVRDQSVLRKYILKMETIKKDYCEGKIENVGDFLNASSMELEQISSSRAVGGFKTAREVGDIVKNRINLEKNRSNKKLSGVDTGYILLNEYTHGWQPGSLVVLAARPSVGKTAFAINLAYNAAIHENKTVAFFSCEMPSEDIERRLCAAESLVSLEKIQMGDFHGNELVKVMSALDQIGQTHIYFDDTPNQKLGDIVAKSRKLAQQHPDLCAIFIDYLNIIGVETKYDSRNLEIALITKTLKELARTLRIPVITLAQLNRDVDKTESKVPNMSQLKESGSIEQDADMVLLMYRKDYYQSINQEVKPSGAANSDYAKALENQVNESKAKGKDEGNVSVISINLAKNRNGRTGNISLLFSKSYQRFDNPTLDMQRQEASMNGEGMNINPME